MKILENFNGVLVNRPWLRKVIMNILCLSILQSFFVSLAVGAGIKLRQEAKRCDSIRDYVNLAFSFTNTFLLSIAPFQLKKEITELIDILAKRKPTFVLEIGTSRGGTLFLLTRISSPNAVIISIDLPQGEFGGVFYPNWKTQFYESFAINQQKIHLIREDSHASSTVDLVKRILDGQRLDFLFIDGDHTYEGVKLDFRAYSSLVNKGGLIAFHDICSGPQELVGEVDRFWDMIKLAYNYKEIVGNPDQKGFGIGLLSI
jgi:predicted O-methyltransferase YrrM